MADPTPTTRSTVTGRRRAAWTPTDPRPSVHNRATDPRASRDATRPDAEPRLGPYEFRYPVDFGYSSTIGD